MPFGRVPSMLSARCSLRAGSVDRCWVASLSCHAGSARSRTSLSLLCERARISRNAPGTLRGSNRGAIRRPQVFVMNLRGTTSKRAEIHTRWEREHLYSTMALRWNKISYLRFRAVADVLLSTVASHPVYFDALYPCDRWSRGEGSQGLNTGACMRPLRIPYF